MIDEVSSVSLVNTINDLLNQKERTEVGAKQMDGKLKRGMTFRRCL